MKFVIKLEEFAMFLLAAWALYFTDAPWWVFLLLLLGPDISMLGYLAGDRAGAMFYNVFHHKGLAIAIFITGTILGQQGVVWAGIILFGHSSMDRMFGYGLKHFLGFRHTHLGLIGKDK